MDVDALAQDGIGVGVVDLPCLRYLWQPNRFAVLGAGWCWNWVGLPLLVVAFSEEDSTRNSLLQWF